jgi:hAT family C-terminal dimerisation region
VQLALGRRRVGPGVGRRPELDDAAANDETTFDVLESYFSSRRESSTAKAERRQRLLCALSKLRGFFAQTPPEVKATMLVSGDPLLFWRTWALNADQDFRLLCPLARSVLCVPATSAPSESLFSTAGFLMSRRRTSMSFEKLEQSTMIVRNFHLFPTIDAFIARALPPPLV